MDLKLDIKEFKDSSDTRRSQFSSNRDKQLQQNKGQSTFLSSQKYQQQAPIVNDLRRYLKKKNFVQKEVDLELLFSPQAKRTKSQFSKFQQKGLERMKITKAEEKVLKQEQQYQVGMSKYKENFNNVQQYIDSLRQMPSQKNLKETIAQNIKNASQNKIQQDHMKKQQMDNEEDEFQSDQEKENRHMRQHRIMRDLNKKLKLNQKSREIKFNQNLSMFKDMDTFVDIKPFLIDMNIVNHEHQYKLMNRLKEKLDQKRQRDMLNEMLYPVKEPNEEKELLGIEEHEFVPKKELVKKACKNVMEFRRKKKDKFDMLTHKQVEYLKDIMLNQKEELGDPTSDNGMFYEQLKEMLFNPKTVQLQNPVEKNEEDEEMIELLMDKYLDNDIEESDKVLFKEIQERANKKFATAEEFKNPQKKDLASEDYFKEYREKCEKIQRTLRRINELQFKYKWGNAQMKMKQAREVEKKELFEKINHPERREFDKILQPSKETEYMSHNQKYLQKTKFQQTLHPNKSHLKIEQEDDVRSIASRQSRSARRKLSNISNQSRQLSQSEIPTPKSIKVIEKKNSEMINSQIDVSQYDSKDGEQEENKEGKTEGQKLIEEFEQNKKLEQEIKLQQSADFMKPIKAVQENQTSLQIPQNSKQYNLRKSTPNIGKYITNYFSFSTQPNETVKLSKKDFNNELKKMQHEQTDDLITRKEQYYQATNTSTFKQIYQQVQDEESNMKNNIMITLETGNNMENSLPIVNGTESSSQQVMKQSNPYMLASSQFTQQQSLQGRNSSLMPGLNSSIQKEKDNILQQQKKQGKGIKKFSKNTSTNSIMYNSRYKSQQKKKLKNQEQQQVIKMQRKKMDAFIRGVGQFQSEKIDQDVISKYHEFSNNMELDRKKYDKPTIESIRNLKPNYAQ